MRPFAVSPPTDLAGILPGTDFVDSFAVDRAGPPLDATRAARLMFEQSPVWARLLLKIRNAIVSPFGLLTGADKTLPSESRCGIFPIVSATTRRVVLGFDDAHLDFRVVVDTSTDASGNSRVTATTLVKRNNLFGRVYLATIMPFHKLIVPNALARVAP